MTEGSGHSPAPEQKRVSMGTSVVGGRLCLLLISSARSGLGLHSRLTHGCTTIMEGLILSAGS